MRRHGIDRPRADLAHRTCTHARRTSRDAGLRRRCRRVRSRRDAVRGGIVVTNNQVFPLPTPPATCASAHPGSIQFGGSCLLVTGYDGIVHSSDSGQTWSSLVKPMGSTTVPPGPFPFASGSGNPAGTFDRPWVKVDQSTNIVYESGANIADHERFVTASTDDGQTFGTIYAVDSPNYPSGGLSGGTIAAANGVLAVAYIAVPAPGGCAATCLIFETSTDQGATFTRHVVPTVNSASPPRPFVAADTTGNGDFALTILDSTGTQNQVYTTSDSGMTWKGPALVGETPRTLASSHGSPSAPPDRCVGVAHRARQSYDCPL